MNAKISIPVMIALIGIVLGVIGFFLGWIDNSTYTITVEYSGYSYLFKDGAEFTVHAMFILVALLCALIVAVTELKGKGTVLTKMLFMIFGIVAFLLPFLIFVQAERFAAIGLFVEIAAGFILMVGTFLNVFTGKK